MMNSRTLTALFLLASFALGFAFLHPAGLADTTDSLGTLAPQASPMDLSRKVSVNVQGLDAPSFFNLLSGQSGVPITVSSDVTAKLTYVATNLPVQEVLDDITAQNGLEYTINNGTIRVGNRGDAPTGGDGFEIVRRIPLKFANCGEVLGKIQSALDKSSKVMADETTNSIVYMGSSDGYDKVAQLAAFFDSDPKQVMIQGLIVEANETFLQSVGFSYNIDKAMVTNMSPSSPNLTLTAATIASHNLNVLLGAAESRGDAKVLSRPKLVTLNNKPATLSSGLTLYVKTLSTTQSAQPGQVPVAVTGGLSEISEGLNVTITPTIVGDDRIRLQLSVSSSSPDGSATVDGIPGVDTDAANTTVIVENERTAIIAGLIKQTKSVSHDGVPFLMDIPILGALFRSDNRSNQNNELAIFITPSVLKAITQAAFYPEKVPAPTAMLDSVGDRHPASAINQVLESPLDSPRTKP